MVEFDVGLVVAGLVVGFTVGLTGMGGGALMTPILVLFFGVPALAAVSSDLLVSLVMKPVGAGVHLRQGTVDWPLVRWLCFGSVPAAFGGALLLHGLDAALLDALLRRALGIALLTAAACIVLKRLVDRGRAAPPVTADRVEVRPLPTLAIGAAGGAMVGITSVGSGSLIIVLLLLLYPGMRSSSLVGTDLAQAIPLVGAATIGHLLFGGVQLPLAMALLAGGLPGVYAGARLSSRAGEVVVRPALLLVLVGSGLKLARVI